MKRAHQAITVDVALPERTPGVRAGSVERDDAGAVPHQRDRHAPHEHLDRAITRKVRRGEHVAPALRIDHRRGLLAPAGQHGNYELRNTQRFVAGHYENVTVQECREKRHGWRRDTICRPVVRSQWVPGSYQTVQEWVWVPSHRPQQYSQYPGHRPPPPTNQGRVGFHVSIR